VVDVTSSEGFIVSKVLQILTELICSFQTFQHVACDRFSKYIFKVHAVVMNLGMEQVMQD